MDSKTKAFDAVEMSRELREKTSKLLEGMTREERIETFRRARAQHVEERAAYVAERAAYLEKQKTRRSSAAR